MLSKTASLTEKPPVQYKVTYMYKFHCSMNYNPPSDGSRSKEDQRQQQ